MYKAIIADASCLILLTKIHRLHLLCEVYGEIIIPSIVAFEYGLKLPSWIRVVDSTDKELLSRLQTLVDPGEAGAISVALERKPSILIIDDQIGRRQAIIEGLTTIGTLGVLLEAKQLGFIRAVRPVIDEILQTNFRIYERIIDTVLQRAGE